MQSTPSKWGTSIPNLRNGGSSVKAPEKAENGAQTPDRPDGTGNTARTRSADTGEPEPEDGPEITKLDGRDYRAGPVRGKMLPTALVRSTGLVTHQGSPREELAVLAIAAYVDGIKPENDGVEYVNRHRGTLHVVRREDGTIWKSRQSFTEDVRRRLYKRTEAPDDGELRADWTDEFARDYDRIRHATDRVSAYLSNDGAATETSVPMLDCLNGRRWRVADELRDLPDAPEPRDCVPCTGPEPTIDWGALYIDPLDALERITAHREKLHRRFKAGAKQQQHRGEFAPREAKRHARASHEWTARRGSDRPQYVTAGRWQSEDDVGDTSAPCTVPWIVFDLDAGTKAENERHADRLMTLLRQRMEAEAFADVLAVDTGGDGHHVRLPAGALGNDVYRDGHACPRALSRFASRLCADDPDLLDALDLSLFKPTQNVRMVGSTHTSGRRCVAITGAEYRSCPDPFTLLRGHSEADTYSPVTLPDPTATPYCPSLARLLHDVERSRPSNHDPARGGDRQSVVKPGATGEYERALRVQHEGEKWGRDVDKPDLVGRNRACLTVSLRKLTVRRTPSEAWRDVRAWNRQMAEPLPEPEARRVFEHARAYRNRKQTTPSR
jgi:hypothetical protein